MKPLSANADHRSLPGPEDIRRVVLDNGITVLSRSNFNSPSVTISGHLRTGSLYDPDEKLGLADFATAALMRGTQKHTFDALYNELESVGASLGFDSGTSSSRLHGHALIEDLPLVLRLLAEILHGPTFPAGEVEKLRHHLLTGLAIRAQDTADMADLTFDEILYKDHPYGRPEDGNPKTIKAIKRADLVGFHKRTFGPAGMVVAVVGAIDAQKAIDVVQRALGRWKNPNQPAMDRVEDPKPIRGTVERHHKIAGKAQADILVGTNGPRRKDADYMAASLGNSVLGQFGMMGRVGKSVREVSGLAYYAYSSLNAGLGPSSWTVSAGVNPTNVKKASDLIVEELKRFVHDGVSAEELADSQTNFIGRLPLSLESNAGVAGALLNVERFDLGLDYYQRYEGLVRKVTREDVLRTAQRFIDPDRLVIATAGP